jgi:hypothetical protein
MPYADKIYVAVENGETKVEIRVAGKEGNYMVVMDCVDAQLKSHFKAPNPLVIGKTIKEVIANCKTWIKENLGKDMDIHEKRIT